VEEEERRRIVVVGATSAIAGHCARIWAQRGPTDLVLVGRDAAKLEHVASDLRVRGSASDIRIVQLDFLDTEEIASTVASIAQEPIDIVLIAHGALPLQDACQTDLALCRETLEVNGVSPVLFAEAFAGAMDENREATIALIGSVAGDRGRKSNYVYGSAKGLIDRYAQGLQHRFYGTKIRVVLVKPGPTDTPMTARLRAEGASLAPAAGVARRIVNAIDKGRGVVYAPCHWSLVMRALRCLPDFVFYRLNI
jgi:short-subunit dehydrogenase